MSFACRAPMVSGAGTFHHSSGSALRLSSSCHDRVTPGHSPVVGGDPASDIRYNEHQMPEKLPRPVTLLLDRIETVMQLEVLLALRDAARTVEPSDLTRSIGGSVDHVADALGALERAGLATRVNDHLVDGFAYRAGRADASVDRLAEIYPSHRVRIVAYVAGRATD
jgi:hypothetical protein